MFRDGILHREVLGVCECPQHSVIRSHPLGKHWLNKTNVLCTDRGFYLSFLLITLHELNHRWTTDTYPYPHQVVSAFLSRLLTHSAASYRLECDLNKESQSLVDRPLPDTLFNLEISETDLWVKASEFLADTA